MSNAILATDPQAIEKLTEKLQDLEEQRKRLKTINATYRRHGIPGLEHLGLSGRNLEHYRAFARENPTAKAPHEPWQLQNLGATIRATKARIAELQAKRAREDVEIPFEGGIYEESVEDDRVRVHFDSRLSKDDYRWMGGRGFRYSRTLDCFQRHLNENGRYAAREAIQRICGQSLGKSPIAV